MFDLDLKLIKPKNVKESDKYSSNLYRIMQKIQKQYGLKNTKVYFTCCELG